MAKRLYDCMVQELEKVLDGCEVDLLSLEQGVKRNEDGSQESFTRLEVEIPKGNGAFSRCRFSCKLPPTHLNVSEDDLDAGLSVKISGLKVSFISNQKEIYMRGNAITIVE